MALTSQQNIPEKPKESEPWTTKKLLRLSGVVTSVAKVFVSPLDVSLGLTVLLLGLAELFGADVSWGLYVLAALILIAVFIERNKDFFLNIKPLKKRK